MLHYTLRVKIHEILEYKSFSCVKSCGAVGSITIQTSKIVKFLDEIKRRPLQCNAYFYSSTTWFRESDWVNTMLSSFSYTFLFYTYSLYVFNSSVSIARVCAVYNVTRYFPPPSPLALFFFICIRYIYIYIKFVREHCCVITIPRCDFILGGEKEGGKKGERVKIQYQSKI